MTGDNMGYVVSIDESKDISIGRFSGFQNNKPHYWINGVSVPAARGFVTDNLIDATELARMLAEDDSIITLHGCDMQLNLTGELK